ncbi:MAG: YfhO family protein [Bacteroidetes bacterium]|nr:YfhO family protein [Bacteroidota bacterium]
MKLNDFKHFYPYLVGIVLFITLSLAFFYPVLQGKRLVQGDITRFQGMAKEIVDFREQTGEEPLWTNNMFSGMPAYMTSVKFHNNLMTYVDRYLGLGLPHPADYVFIYFLGFFILLLVLRVNPWLSIIGAMAFAFSSYFFIILEAGHNTKAAAIGYMAPVLAGIILTYRGRYLAGAALTAFFLALELRANHLQITYYLLLIVIFFGIFELADAIRNKGLTKFLKATGVLLLAAFLAVGTHITSLWITADHSRFTTRGPSELTLDEVNKTSGLDRDYITDWSYGVAESFTLLIPDFAGGASSSSLGENSKVYDVLVENNIPPQQAKQYVRQLPISVYWGPQPFTSGPVYVGAIIIFFFVLALFVVKGKYKWWLLAVTILSLFLAWGKNFMVFTDFFLDYIPGYNKFRAVSMTMVIAELSIPLLAMIGLAKIFQDGTGKENLKKYLKYSLYILGGLLLLFIVFPGLFYGSNIESDAYYRSQLIRVGFPETLANAIMSALEGDRLRILRMDALRSLIFILLSFGAIWLWNAGRLKMVYTLLLIGFFIFIDMWFVNRRYLSNDNFVRKSKLEQPFIPTVADNEILKDKDPNFRVLNLTVSTFNDAATSYFHKSIGGYHGAKLGRYQELIEYQISPEIRKLTTNLSGQPTPESVNRTLAGLPVLNMLNTKYIIINPQSAPLENPFALGNAWFVRDYRMVGNADEELTSLAAIDPAETALVDQRFASFLEKFAIQPDSVAQISFLEYAPNHLKYATRTNSDQLAVFSEIYYPNGWTAYIDGEPADHFRVNYVLRAMIIPAGEHSVEFIFRPEIYYRGEIISLISSIVLIILVLGALFTGFRKTKQEA